MKRKILFICLGNICRSATAEEVLRVKAKEAGVDLIVDSAGIIDYHHSRPVRTEDFDKFDLIIAMDENNVRGLEKLVRNDDDRDKIYRATAFISQYDTLNIPDPYYGGPEDFEWAIDLIEDCCDGIIKSIR